MNEIKIYLKPSGSTAELYKDFSLYQESYRNVQISIYVPTTILYKSADNRFYNAVQTGAIMTAPNGAKVVTKSFNANYVKTVMHNSIEYAMYTQIMPKEFMLYAGTQIIVCNIINIDNANETAPKLISVVTSQRVPIVVSESAYLLNDETLDPTETEVMDGLINDLQQRLNDGTFAARAIYPYSSDYIYGANELVFYPDKGEYGVFLKSLVTDNNKPPYTGEGLNCNYWEEIADFNILNELYRIKTEVEQMFLSATEQATAAANSAAQASVSEQNAANSATGAESAKQAAQASAAEAHNWADIAKQWADYGIKINTEYTSLEELPDPGDSRFIYLIPNGGTGENSYDEYIWADSKSAYEKIGTTEIDLTAYATKNEVNEGLQGKLDKTDGVAENLSVKNNLTALTIDTEHINGRAGEPLIEQRPRMYAIAFGNMNNEMRLYGKAERPVYTANKVDADGELTTAEEEVAFVSDVDQKVNKSGDTMTGGLTVPALNVDSGNGDGLYIELGRRGNTGLEFHCQQNADVYRDFDATIQARDANSTASNGSGVLNYVAREHSFEGSIVAPGTHNFIERGNEFNFANGYSGNEIWLNYRNASIGQYVFGNGAGGAANVIAGEVYDNDARVYSPNNKQPIITQSYLGGNPTTQKNCYGYLVFDSGNNGTGEIMICFGMFTSTTAEISFAKPFYGTPFVMTSPNHSTDMQTQRVAVKTTTNTGFTTESSGSYSGRYIAIGYR